MLKDNKVPGTCTGTRVAKDPALVQGLLQDSWERARLGCVRGQVLVWTWGLNRRNFSKRKRENRGTQQLDRELPAAAKASCDPTPSAPGL